MSLPDLLIVDSYDHARTALAELLRGSGYAVREASNGVEGMLATRQRMPDLVVAELWPFFSASLQMMERLRRASAPREIPVVVVTTVVAPEYQARALAAGCAAYLEKPCPPEVVLAAIRDLLPPAPGPCPGERATLPAA